MNPTLLAMAVLTASPAPMVIVALGDSTTAGTPFFSSPVEAPPDGRGDATAPFTYWMMKERPGWKVLNRGVNGQRSDEIRARFEHDVLSAHPAAVVILAGVNDVYQGYPLRHISEQLSALYTLAQTNGITPVAVTVLPFSLATPEQSAAIQQLNGWIQETAQRRKIPLCDLHAVVADPAHPDRLRGSPEGLHLDRAGYRAMGEALVRCLEAGANLKPR